MIEMLLLILLGVVGSLYLYMNYKYNYWKRKGLPQPSTTFGFGNIYDGVIAKKNLGLIFTEIYNLYPGHDAVGLYTFLTPTLLLRNPELVKKVVVTEFSSFHDNSITANKTYDPYFSMDPFVVRGEEWKPARAKLVATVTGARIKEIFPLMKGIVPRLYSYLDENLEKDVEAKELASLFTMDNVSNTVYGISSNCFTDPEAPFRKFADSIMKDQLQTWWKTIIIFLLPTIRDLIGFRFVPKEVNDFLENMVKDVMDYRKKNNVSRNDLFQYLLKKESGDFHEIMIHCMTFFIEGFETSSMVASIVLYELSQNSEVQQNLYEEVKAMYEIHTDPDFETIMNLPYLEKIIQEAQRKYPVLFTYSRVCTKPCTLEIDGKQVEIEPGTGVLIPVFAIHRDPNYYPDPELFDPERFNEEQISARPAYTYMPFGEGPRICPGMRFGLIQVKLLICSVVYKYRIGATEKTPKKLTLLPSSLLVVPNENMWIRLEKRK